MIIEDQTILDLLDDFLHYRIQYTCAREKLVQALKKLGFSDEQAHFEIMRHQSEAQELYRSLQELQTKKNTLTRTKKNERKLRLPSTPP
jgi:hypothetical protein